MLIYKRNIFISSKYCVVRVLSYIPNIIGAGITADVWKVLSTSGCAWGPRWDGEAHHVQSA